MLMAIRRLVLRQDLGLPILDLGVARVNVCERLPVGVTDDIARHAVSSAIDARVR
jgi:hypothetical protein